MNGFEIGDTIIFKEDHNEFIKKASIATVIGFCDSLIKFKIMDNDDNITGECLYSEINKIKPKNKEKIIVSKKVADSIEWLVNGKLTIKEFLKMLNGTNELESSKKELKELLKLDNAIILKLLTEGYEVKKEKLENLPIRLKFKMIDNDNTFYLSRDHYGKEVIISWQDEIGIDSIIYDKELCLKNLNDATWTIID